ncbi:MAG: DMT family transporter [Euryarchaeota archaeon]|nr:DMT family transporter [Euryarchaeota archaeon]
MLMGVGAAVLFGASAPLAKLLLGTIDPVMLAGLLYLGSGLGMALAKAVQTVAGRSGSEASLRRMDFPWLLSALVVGGVAAPIILMLGLGTTPASTAALLLNFEAVGTVVVARLMFREAVGRWVWLALALVTVGSAVLSMDGGDGWGLSLGAVAILAACLLWGLDNNITRNVSARDPVSIVAIKGMGAGLFSVALAYALGRNFPVVSTALAAMLVGFVCYGLSIALYVRALRDMGAARTGALFGTAPFVGAAMSLLIFHDTLTLGFIASVPLMIVGAVILFKEAHAHTHVHLSEIHEHRHAHDDGHHDHTHEKSVEGAHSHPHQHEALGHTHSHAPDIHHRHGHEE